LAVFLFFARRIAALRFGRDWALNRRADRPPSCPVLGVFLPRQPLTGAAVDDPQRHFGAVN